MPSKPIVFLHGFLGTPKDWDKVLSYLPNHECICIDLPGHRAAPFSPFFDFAPPASKFHLVGYSLGGRLALAYASKYPERIETLILVSTHTGISSEKEKAERLIKDSGWAKLLTEIPLDLFLPLWYSQEIFAGFQPDLAERSKHDPQALSSVLMHYSLSKQPVYQIENAIHIVGERDQKFRALHPNAILIPDAGHMVHIEQPEALAARIEFCLL